MEKQNQFGRELLLSLRNFIRLLLVSFLLGLAGCGGGTSDSGTSGTSQTNATPEQLAATLAEPFSEATSIDASVAALRLSGLTVVSDDGAVLAAVTTDPTAQGLSLLRFQARGMAQEVANRDGMSGASIDRMTPPIPLPGVDQSITVSMMLAAYVKTADSNGAKVARGLMGDIDTAKHAEYTYPSIVVLSFLQEVAVPLLAEMEKEHGPAAAAPLAAAIISAASFSGNPCGAINDFLNDLPATVTRAVSSISPQSSSFWSSVVAVAAVVAGVATNLAVDAAKGLIRHAPGVDAVRSGMTALHAAADIKAMLTQWKVEVTGSPGNLHKIPGDSTAGTFTVTLSNGGPAAPSWPPVVQSCADLLAIPLPDFNNPSATVEWKKVAGFDALALESSRVNALANGKAEFKFNTATESQEVHDNPGSDKKTGPVTVSATVSLPGLESLLSALAPSLGGVAGTAVSGAATPVAQELGTAKQGSVPVEYHTSKPASADLDGPVMKLHAYSCNGLYGVWTGTFTEQTPAGPISSTANWQFGADGTAQSTYSYSYDVECAHVETQRTWSLVLTGAPDSPAIDGEINAAQSTIALQGIATCPPGGGASSTAGDQHLGIAPILMGPSAECPAP